MGQDSTSGRNAAHLAKETLSYWLGFEGDRASGIARILEAIYEQDFLDCSYGFRPNRSCHQAFDNLMKYVQVPDQE